MTDESRFDHSGAGKHGTWQQSANQVAALLLVDGFGVGYWLTVQVPGLKIFGIVVLVPTPIAGCVPVWSPQFLATTCQAQERAGFN